MARKLHSFIHSFIHSFTLSNLKKYLHNITPFSPIVLLTTLLVVLVLFYKLALGYYEAKYTESAHGNNPSGAGVNRTGVSSFGYAVGNCAHCHEQKASIGGAEPSPTGGPDQFLLFAPNNQDSQTANFCFQCHKGAGSVQVGGITNYTYSKNFGGGAQTFTTIYDAFNPTTGTIPSSHNLKDIQDWVTGRAGFTSDSNPCVVCHNPHTAQDNHPVSLSGRGGVNTAIRRVLDYQDYNTNLWGDEDDTPSGYYERMKDLADYTSTSYQAPYYVGKATYEPANNATSDGINLPNFATFCWDCHRYANVTSTEHGTLDPINWTKSTTPPGWPQVHGTYTNDPRADSDGYLIAPYDNTTNYVLACTDCHEPHGSPNEYLLRTCVNGKDNILITSSGRWYEFCTACHGGLTPGGEHDPLSFCHGCHKHSKKAFM